MFALAIRSTPSAASSTLRPERLCDPPLDRLARPIDVELHPPFQEEVVRDAPEHELRVRIRRLPAPLPVTGGAGVGARALRPAPRVAGGIEPGDRAAAGADRDDVDRREADRHAPLEVEGPRQLRLSVPDDGDVRARAAHVEAHDVAPAARSRDRGARDHAGRRPRVQRLDRRTLGVIGRHRAAAVVHDEHDVAAEARI